MAKLEQTFYGDFDDLLNRIEEGIQRGSSSASLEDSSDFYAGDSRCRPCASLSATAGRAATASA